MLAAVSMMFAAPFAAVVVAASVVFAAAVVSGTGVAAAISCLDRGTREANIPMGGNGSLWSE